MLHELNDQLRHILKDIRLQQKPSLPEGADGTALKDAEKSLIEAERKLIKELRMSRY